MILDCNSIIHRAYHALPRLTTSEGEPVGAVYGFLLVFFKAVKEFKPDYIGAVFDFPAPTFRHKIFKAYKAKRPPAPKELYDQIAKTKTLLADFGLSIFEQEGFEADDVIGTIAKLSLRQQAFPRVANIIVSGDKDVLQLVDENTRVYLLRKGVKDVVLYDKDKVRELYGGLAPRQIIELKGLAGDPSDNIPGVMGIGAKTAQELILRVGTVDNLYKQLEMGAEKDIKPKIKEVLLRHKDEALLSRELAAIDTGVPLDFQLNKDCLWQASSKEKAEASLKNLGFHSLAGKVP